MAFAGLVLMLFLPLALILNLGIASGPVAFGLAPAAWVALAGFVLLLAVMGMEKMGREDHARDRMFAILFLIALHPLFWGLFEQAGGSMNLFTDRSEEHTSELQSLMRTSYAVFCMKNKKIQQSHTSNA